LRLLRPGDALLIHGTLPPARLVSRPWDIDRRLRRLAAGKGPVPERHVAPSTPADRADDPTTQSQPLALPAELAYTAENPVVAHRMEAGRSTRAA
jgi:hypothetical protein